MKVSPSYFVPFSKNEACTEQVREETIQTYLLDMYLMSQAGVVSTEHLEEHRALMCSFLSNSTKEGIGCVSDARTYVFPSGFFIDKVQHGVICTSKRMKIGEYDALYLRAKLGKVAFNRILISIGLIKDQVTLKEHERASPMEIDWQCNGLPACGEQNAVVFGTTDQNLRKFALGTEDEGSMFWGQFYCQHCHKKARGWEGITRRLAGEHDHPTVLRMDKRNRQQLEH